MNDLRKMLKCYVEVGKAMQLATLDEQGHPYVNNLWFASRFAPDRLYFISRPNRVHSANIRRDPRVAGAVLAVEPDELGEPVRGVTFTGTAVELATEGIAEQIAAYIGRWPRAARAVDPVRLANGEAHHRIYEIHVTSWILYDEEHFPADPRQPVHVAA